MSLPFRLILEARRKLYETGLFRTRRLSHPVISIGNLTLGGTGKTPLTLWLAGKLCDAGYRPVVLSRGYGRAGRGITIVSRGAGPEVDAATAGDEPFLIARRVPGVAVVVGADRYEAGLASERANLGNLFILDDGFQHRRLYRSVDIVTIDAEEWQAGERLLPWGPWREPKSALMRAHAACVRLGAHNALPSLPIPAFTIHTAIDGIYEGARPVAIESIGRPIVAFAGIAKPARFFAALEGMGVHPDRRAEFQDHHAYTTADIERLGAGTLVTTEKDFVRLEGRVRNRLLHLRISASIAEETRLLDLIERRIRIEYPRTVQGIVR